MSSEITPKYLKDEESLRQECKDLLTTLPREKGWLSSHMYNYQGFWYESIYLQGVISCQKQFQVKDSDVFLVTHPKSGTTWLKAIMFTLLNRKQYPLSANHNHHPLLTHNPHDLVPSLEINIYGHNNQIPEIASFPSRRFFSTHMPYVSLPESVRNSSTCKIVYVCRNPKDTFVSLWHFMNKLRMRERRRDSMDEDFEMYSEGLSLSGPFWDHILQYWKQTLENPDRVLFLKYEDMKDQSALHLRRLAEFLDCPFSAEEEESGVVSEILKLTSFDHMSSLEVNRNGVLANGMGNSGFFRRGEVGDWKNHLSDEMVQKLDQITHDKFFGSGLVFL